MLVFDKKLYKCIRRILQCLFFKQESSFIMINYEKLLPNVANNVIQLNWMICIFQIFFLYFLHETVKIREIGFLIQITYSGIKHECGVFLCLSALQQQRQAFIDCDSIKLSELKTTLSALSNNYKMSIFNSQCQFYF